MGKVIAIGGGNNGGDFDRKIEEKVRSFISNKHPKVMFIPYGSDEYEENYQDFFSIYHFLGCQVELLEPGKEEKLLEVDLIYLGRGWMIPLLKKLEMTNAIPIISQAINNGTILAGFSAGAHALFTKAYSYEETGYTLVKGLNLIEGCLMSHYNYQDRRDAYHKFLSLNNLNGIGLEDHSMLVVEENQITLYSSKDESKGFLIKTMGSQITISPIPVEKIY